MGLVQERHSGDRRKGRLGVRGKVRTETSEATVARGLFNDKGCNNNNNHICSTAGGLATIGGCAPVGRLQEAVKVKGDLSSLGGNH